MKLELEPRSSALGHMWAWTHHTISLFFLRSVYSSEHLSWISSNGIPEHFIVKPNMALILYSKDRFFPTITWGHKMLQLKATLKIFSSSGFQIVFHRTLSALRGASEAPATPRSKREQATSRIPTLIAFGALCFYMLCTLYFHIDFVWSLKDENHWSGPYPSFSWWRYWVQNGWNSQSHGWAWQAVELGCLLEWSSTTLAEKKEPGHPDSWAS